VVVVLCPDFVRTKVVEICLKIAAFLDNIVNYFIVLVDCEGWWW